MVAKPVKKLILFDLDSTLIDCEVIDEIAKLAGVEGEVKKITNDAMKGNLKFEDSLKQRVIFLKGLESEKIDFFVQKIPIMNGAKELILELKKIGYVTGVVSGGFTFAANEVKKILSLDYAYSNTLLSNDGRLTGEVIGPVMGESAKGDILEEIAKKENISLENTVVVGDGANDISMFEKAGFRIAFCAKEILKSKADVCIDKKDLREILDYLK
ncbi:phosphoserine phosphatase SerB [Methanococcus vannielii SB]|uniref:phosphoserine phosphatase n=1 Tax=Methanococcus vannielii (strain ATCC 35089 / DSM 1224 / JCM 13029 / OCM 148 / SB) TaxID=406327 RepID=A6USW5_METVS|nr:phosphoserine phosphatase SerB [Methanococcus vannielii]ABR55587.1 phosphoserine phosphatase SerB [Methanococcus vannielii SB]